MEVQGERCERMSFMGYPVRVTVQNKPVNLDNAPHFTIYLSPILDDEVRPYRRYVTFEITLKPLRIELTYLKSNKQKTHTIHSV